MPGGDVQPGLFVLRIYDDGQISSAMIYYDDDGYNGNTKEPVHCCDVTEVNVCMDEIKQKEKRI